MTPENIERLRLHAMFCKKYELHFAADRLEEAADEMERLVNERASLVEALDEIANNPHCEYRAIAGNGYERGYAVGVVDGHRCAAQIARATLSRAHGKPSRTEDQQSGR